jgi:hypothetical protein
MPARTLLKTALTYFVHIPPRPALREDRLYFFLDLLYQTRNVPGAVVEIGCFQCGTSAIAARFLKHLASPKPYVAIDTFEGFESRQFEQDTRMGTDQSVRNGFSETSHSYVRRLIATWDVNVRTLKRDVVTMDKSELPSAISCALIDTDLYAPTRSALDKLMPLLHPFGFILIDDCDENGMFVGAKRAYIDYAEEHGLRPEFRFGMGVIHGKDLQVSVKFDQVLLGPQT